MSDNGSRSVGKFAWNTVTGQWTWDAGMYELHGYPAGAVAVSTELVIGHKADDSRDVAAGVLRAAARGDRTFSNYHSIVDASGRRRTVVTVGESRTDATRPQHTQRYSRGFMIDLTGEERDLAHRTVSAVRESTAPIQQSVGLLMGSLGISEAAALSFMLRVSNHHNVKVRDLARRFMEAAVVTAGDSPRDLAQTLIGRAAALATERATDESPAD